MSASTDGGAGGLHFARAPAAAFLRAHAMRCCTFIGSKGYPVKAVILAILPAIVFTALVGHPGHLIFTRDPFLYASYQADLHWTTPVFPVDGGLSSIATQGMFYEPYAALLIVLRYLSFGPQMAQLTIVFVVAAIGSVGIFSLAGRITTRILPRFASSVFLLLNPWSVDTFGYFFIWTGYCMMPFVVAAVLRARRSRGFPIGLVLALLLSGGAVAWFVNAVVVMIAALIGLSKSVKSQGKVFMRVSGALVFGSLYWLVPYMVTLVKSHVAQSGYASLGPPLQTKNPVVDFISNEGFWWPHLNIAQTLGVLLGSFVASVSALAIVLLIYVVANVRAGSNEHEARELHGVVISMLMIGFMLASGTAGAVGGIYGVLRQWPLPGHSLIAGLFRTPTDLGGMFFVAMALSLVYLLKGTFVGAPGLMALRGGYAGRAITGVIVLGASAIMLVASVVTFASTYRPVMVPAYYSRLSNLDVRGIALDVADWDNSSIQQPAGTWLYSWSTRVAADPTLLAASTPSSYLSPMSPNVNRVLQRYIEEGNVGASVVGFGRLLERLGVSTVIAQRDIRLTPSDRSQYDGFLNALRSEYPNPTYLGRIEVFNTRIPIRGAVWSNICSVGRGMLWAGVVTVKCMSGLGRSRPLLMSPFPFTGPVLAVGGDVVGVASLADGIGSSVRLAVRSSAIVVDLPIILSFAAAFVEILVVSGVGLLRLSRLRVRNRAV